MEARSCPFPFEYAHSIANDLDLWLLILRTCPFTNVYRIVSSLFDIEYSPDFLLTQVANMISHIVSFEY